MIKNKNTKLQTFILMCIIAALGIFMVTFGSVLKRAQAENDTNDGKISVLIDEVGELRQELDEKEKTINQMYEHVSVTSQELGKINKTIQESIQRSSNEWENIKGDLSNSNQQLNELLKEKESVINELAYKNQNLQKEINLPKLDPNIVNALIIGHNAKLTDTILLASINPNTQKISFVSIPRDLYYKGRKINELYSKYGVTELQRAVAEITGVYPEQYVIFNFDSFVDLVDILGGITIDVEKRLVDNAYPGPGNSYMKIVFEPGTYKMDGETALKYARSRKSTSDFDRAARQQQVIEAVKNKAKELNITTRLDLATKVYAKIKDNTETNVNLFDGLSYMQHFQGYSIGNASVLSTENFLYSTRSASGQYILLPQGGTYAQIKEHVSASFS